jgi:hypothetical protein
VLTKLFKNHLVFIRLFLSLAIVVCPLYAQNKVNLAEQVKGILPGANGGWGQAIPTPARAGDIFYWNGGAWVSLAGNNSGTNCLQESSIGAPSWGACGGGSGFTPQINGVSLSSAGLNLSTSTANAFGLGCVCVPTLISTINVIPCEISGSATGTGNFVKATSPTLVTPALGTPSSVNLANATFPASIALTANPLSQFAATTSAQLRSIISDESGTGAAIFAGSPALTGTPTAPTASVGDNTTTVATTAFVFANALTYPLTITGGVSGGIPYASSTTALSMSALLAQNHILLGGGAGAAPTSDSLLTDASSTLTYTGTGGVTFSGATPAASGSAFLLGGTVFTGGTTTTTWPYAYINLGTTGADWNTAGTMFGLNSPSGFSGNEIDVHANGSATSLFKVTSAGVGTFSSDLNVLGNYKPNSGHILLDSTAPTVTSAGTSPSIPNQNGTAAFTVNVGTGGTASAVVLAMPTATAGWVCNAADLTNPTTGGGYYVKQTSGSATSVTLTGFSTAGSATAFTASDVLFVSCLAY